MQWIVSQIGARQHYGVPRGFHYKNHLRLLYTDAWCRWGAPLLRRGPRQLRAFAGRFHPDLPSNKVVDFNLESALQMNWTRDHSTTVTDEYLRYLDFGVSFANNVNWHLAKQSLDGDRDLFFGFDTGCFETLEFLQKRGVRSVVDQIDPARVEEDLVLAEIEAWPGWEIAPGRIPDAYFERLAAEWELATIVLVNSEWSKTALIAQGVPREKLLVVPVAFESSLGAQVPRRSLRSVLTVLWLGTVNLRKGIQYLVEAAKQLQRSNIQFVVAGPIAISKEAVASAPSNIAFVGRVTRDQADKWYRKADLFILPTISDGFAITQVEAMTHGLPVITTPNCGAVVTHGIDGVIVPARDSGALAHALSILEKDRSLVAQMSRQARVKATAFQLPRQAEEIERAMERVRNGEPINPGDTIAPAKEDSAPVR